MPTDYEKTEQGDDPSCPRTERAIIEMTFGEYKKREDELLALRARVAELEAALSGLVQRLDKIHDDLSYKTVWMVHQMHVGPYKGPTYVDALAAARAALKDAP